MEVSVLVGATEKNGGGGLIAVLYHIGACYLSPTLPYSNILLSGQAQHENEIRIGC